MSDVYDVLVIGSGPGGYVAAIRAAQLGMKVGVVEREHLGGICLNWGCIPTKALLRSAEVLHLAEHGKSFGLELTRPETIDIAPLVKRSRTVSGQLNGGVGFLLKKNKVDVIWGEATITSPPTQSEAAAIEVREPSKPAVEPQANVPKGTLGPGSYRARNVILATGARPRSIPGVTPDGEHIWTYFEAMKPEVLPKSIVVAGSGAIGIEFASFYRTLGSEVTVVEMLPQILPAEDEEISALARKAFEKQGIRFVTGTRIESVGTSSEGITASLALESGEREMLSAEKLIMAIGVEANTAGLGLEAAGVTLTGGVVATDDFGRTSVPGIWAIGDVACAPMLAHKAEHEGVICVETIHGGTVTKPLVRELIPACTYCTPQIASIGLTEKKARALGRHITIGRFPFRGNGKALAMGETDGMLKTIVDAKSGAILGAHLIGAEVTELVHAYSIAMKMGATAADLMHTVFPHPTLSEMIHESALAADGRAIHM